MRNCIYMRRTGSLEGLSRYNYILHVQEVKGGIHNQNSSIKMVLGLDCFGFMARKAPESSKQQEAEDARKKKTPQKKQHPRRPVRIRVRRL